MKLRNKLLLSYLFVCIIPMLLIGSYMTTIFKSKNLKTLEPLIMAQLIQLDENISSFMKNVEDDVYNLSKDNTVRNKEDSGFTNFLDAEEETFKYNIGIEEKNIVDIFTNFRESHDYVNSVYMGRESGGFVRSPKRNKPTQYDPRQRDWYQLAKSQPDIVVRTSPYKSVTTDDINIGFVKALVNEENQVYGVVGTDITLNDLTKIISNMNIGENSYVFLMDQNGTILTNPDSEKLFKKYDEIELSSLKDVYSDESGFGTFAEDKNKYLIYHTSPLLGWKICAVMDKAVVERSIQETLRALLLILMGIAVLMIILAIQFSKKLTAPVLTGYK